MKRTIVHTLVIGVFVVAAAACASVVPTATPDTQATVDAAVVATGTAQAAVQATIDAAVEATDVAEPTPAPADADAESEASDTPTPTPAPADGETAASEPAEVSEEELAVMIDEAVADAVVATEDCTDATAQAAADAAITQEELEMMAAYLAEAEAAIAYADELAALYYDSYGELATETIALLLAIEEDLSSMAETLATIDTLLQEISTAIEQGSGLAEQTLAQLESAAQAASAVAADVQAQSQGWLPALQAEMEDRVTAALAVQPDNVATNRRAALQSAFEYLEAVRGGLADGSVSQDELAIIAQLGANAAAGLSAQGGAQLGALSGSIEDITAQIARGQVGQARAGLGDLEALLGARR